MLEIKHRHLVRLLSTFGCFLCLMPYSHANFARISRAGFALPADDLVHQGSVLSPEQARRLSLQGVDLSELRPTVLRRGIWEDKLGERLSEDKDEMPIDTGAVVSFQASLRSAPGEFRFNVLTRSREVVTLYADKKLHTTLLRKNYLRKLGYIVPAIKHLQNVRITFTSEEEKELFITKLRREAEGTTKRWIIEEENAGLSLALRDVAAVEVTDTNLYNPAFGVPGGALNSRKLRSLIVPYALLDLKESVNKFSWNVGREENSDRIILPHFFSNNNFATTTYEDARWIAKRMSQLGRDDIEEVVRMSHFPDPVATLVTEKLIARTNALMTLFQVSHRPMRYDSDISEIPHLVGGKIIKRQWRDYGFASEFAAGDATSPFKDFNYYIYSLLQSIGIDSLVARANQELSLFNPNDARIRLAEEEFNRGLEHFVNTGEFLQFPVSTWVSPLASGNLVLSRDVVVGNYLGTENLVQLADTFGYAFSLGAIMGIENVDVLDAVTLSASATYLKTFTHLKPLTSLRDVFKEDYRNLAVSLLKNDLRRHLHEAAEANANFPSREASPEYDEFLASVVDNINNSLGVGESLIIQEKILPSFSAGAKIPITTSGFVVGVSAGAEYIGVKRLQILRKDESTIQIFDDNGYGVGGDFTISLENRIPIIRFEYRVLSGEYSVKSHTVNIDADSEDNPNFMQGIEGLHSLLTANSSEVLQELSEDGITPPSAKVDARFRDRYSRFAFLFWRRQSNKGFTHYDVESTAGLQGEYITHHDYARSGVNWESFTKDLVKYGLNQIEGAENILWRNDVWARPNETFQGHASVLEADYEGQLIDGQLDKEYMAFARRYEGWSRDQGDLRDKVLSLNEDFEKPLFSAQEVEDISRLFLYDIHAKVNIYERGVRRLKSISQNTMIAIATNVDAERRCSRERVEYYRWTDRDGRSVDVSTCGSLRTAINKANSCPRKEDIKEQTECYLKMAKNMFEDMPFSYFVEIVGEDNYYLEGAVNGFRANSEVLNDPMRSSGFGRRHPVYPYGMIRKVQQRVGIQNGEFTGQWLRERP